MQLIAEAAKEVGPSLFFALLIIMVSFLPIFVLGEQSGRLFKPLAFTKTFAMAAGAFLAVTIIPVLMSSFITERSLPDAGAAQTAAGHAGGHRFCRRWPCWSLPMRAGLRRIASGSRSAGWSSPA